MGWPSRQPRDSMDELYTIGVDEDLKAVKHMPLTTWRSGAKGEGIQVKRVEGALLVKLQEGDNW